MTAAPVAVSAPRIELAAVRYIVPVAASVVPFALVIGSAMRQIGVPGSIGVLGGGAMYSGSAHRRSHATTWMRPTDSGATG